MTDPSLRRWSVLSAAVGIAGVALLATVGDRRALWAAPFGQLSVLAICLGLGFAVALAVAPAPRGLKLRHFAAGATAAWLAYELAGGARRMGLPDTDDRFRLLWAPVSEELCKALLLAAVWSQADDHRDRREIVTAAVGVGVGFAVRENFVYFNVALATPPLFLEWILLRAIPPVLAHAAFGMIMGGAVAQNVINARIVGEGASRVSALGVAVAVIAHVAYNGVARLIAAQAGPWTVALISLWSLVALLVAVLLRRQVLRAADADEPSVTSIVPARDCVGLRVGGFAAVVAALWFVPSPASRHLATLVTPLAIGTIGAFAVATALGAPRIITAVLVGVALRPLVRVPEVLLLVLGGALRRPWLRIPLSLLADFVHLGAVALATAWLVGHRRQARATAFAAGLAGGLFGATLGGALASARSEHLARVMLIQCTQSLPLSFALATLAGALGHRSPRRAAGAALGAAAIATCVGETARALFSHRRALSPVVLWGTSAVITLASAALVAVVVRRVLWRAQRERAALDAAPRVIRE